LLLAGQPVYLAFIESGDDRMDSRTTETGRILREQILNELDRNGVAVADTFSVSSGNPADEIRGRLTQLKLDSALVVSARLSGELQQKATMMYQGIASMQLHLSTWRFENGTLQAADVELPLKKQILPLSRWSEDPEKQSLQLSRVAEKIVLKWPTVAGAEFATGLLQLKAEMDRAYGDDIPELLAKAEAVPKDPKKWLLVIGIQDYRNTDHIRYARRSAELFASVVQHIYGVPPENSFLLLDGDATAGEIKNRVRLLLENVREGDTIYFYYNGHGVPVKDQNREPEPYLLPQDAMAAYIQDESFFMLRNFYKTLTDSKAGKVIAFVDSCFAGATDDKSVFKGVAAARLVPKKVSFDQRKMVVLAAGQKDQYSNMYPPKKHRLFSYFVMKSMLSGLKSPVAIHNDISPKVEDASRAMGPLKKQQPTLEGNPAISL